MDVLKARRRVKRFIADPSKKVARVHTTEDENVFEYREKHHALSLFFKKDKLGRLRLMK